MSSLQSKTLTKRKKPRRVSRVDSEQLDRIDSLPWHSSLPEFTSNDDTFSIVAGTNELDGGFLSLEEIDESAYASEIAKFEGGGGFKNEVKPKKRKASEGDNVGGDVNEGFADVSNEDESGGEDEIEDKEVKITNKKTKKRNRKKKKVEEKKEIEDVVAVTDVPEEKDTFDDGEFYAWNELRLHPLIMKSIYRLKFKEPTPIQKACIPAAAHQGKDVIGAAETGSGKTLAFGLPILQRLLEEREKADNISEENGDAGSKIAARGFMRALIITPTRELALQVHDHLKEVAKDTNIRVVPIVGGMSTQKQERLLKARPEIVVGTPGRLWELMSGGQIHLVEMHSLSFFVLDEADRMIENGHFHELQSIIDMLPGVMESAEGRSSHTQSCVTVSSFQRKKRQTLVFSATIALSADFRKKLKRGSVKSKLNDDLNSIENLSQRAGMRPTAAIFDLTNASIMAGRLEESFIECREEDKDAYLYYILAVHGHGQTIVFCTSISALRHISSILLILGVNVYTLHGDMQQRARLKAIDRFRENKDGILVATDIAARGIDIPGVRTVVHYQLPHSAEVYVHRSGRTARASADGCSIGLISPNDTTKFAAMCKSFSKESFKRFPVELSYMPEVLKRMSIARQIDKVMRKESQEKASKGWLQRNAESVEMVVEEDDSEEERVNICRQKKATSVHLKKLQQELKVLLSRPLQPKTFSHRYLAGAGISSLLQDQFEELARHKQDDTKNSGHGNSKMVVIGQSCVEPLEALRSSGHEVHMDFKGGAERRKRLENLRKKRKDEKRRKHDQKRKEKKRLKGLE
ncbi:DEAD-box ATP-dependent RNA helicase 13 [Daucus carota subsp. sativus]|uniref:RNA helicase n=1 Tax=Daucus carota subsp. sativus TaxID=79200 RepID=A0A164T7H7_DAUCS|nr:PREDICTED: DEAD-box ATP-dependent RNA helicase 13 [Daucus carota subsp. sativus]